jgi:hypothetical protein
MSKGSQETGQAVPYKMYWHGEERRGPKRTAIKIQGGGPAKEMQRTWRNV